MAVHIATVFGQSPPQHTGRERWISNIPTGPRSCVEKLNKFMDEVIYPAEPVYEEQMEKAKDRWQLPTVIEELQGRGEEARPVEHVPAGRPRVGRHARHDGPLQPRIRADLRGPRPLLDRLRSGQLLGARHRQHGSVRPLRQQGAQGEVAEAAAQRRDPLLLRHDRAGRSPRPTRATSSAASRATATTTSSTAASGGRRAWAIRAARSSS